jgi:hypothetical protein
MPAQHPLDDRFLGPQDLAEIRAAVQKLNKTRERRNAPRRSYRVTQLIAPYDGTTLPLPGTFCPVRCRDISQSGVSFVLPDRPAFDHVVVALGTPPDLLYLTAKVVRSWRPAALRGDWEVGCRFLRKVRLSV